MTETYIAYSLIENPRVWLFRTALTPSLYSMLPPVAPAMGNG
jgi:hypothetical protein